MIRPLSLLSILLSVAPCLAATTELAPTPPMGWNSWDSYGLTVTEAEFKANVSWLHQHLQPLGWQYVVVDEGWYLRQPGQKDAAQGFVMDATGRYLVADNRFPSAGGGAGFMRRMRLIPRIPAGGIRTTMDSRRIRLHRPITIPSPSCMRDGELTSSRS